MSAIGGLVYFQKQETPIKEFLPSIMHRLTHRGENKEGYALITNESWESCFGSNTDPALISTQRLKPLNTGDGNAWLGVSASISTLNGQNGEQKHQPIVSENQRFAIVFDGDLMNAEALRDELKEGGIAIAEKDDATIVLEGYRVWKERILSKLEGAYAFVIVDLEEKRIFGARDRFGIRPLYYTNDSKIFAFSSEAKGLIHLPFVSKKVSKSVVYDYLVLGISDGSSQSMFRGITELQPGSAFSLLYETGNMKVWAYFHLTTDSKLDRYSRNKVSTLSYRLKKSLANNLSRHLSPGLKSAYHIDSSLESLIFPFLLKEFIEELPAKERPNASEIYMGIFGEVEMGKDAGYQEKQMAKAAMQDLDVSMLESLCRFEDFIENLEKIAYYQDVPFSSLNVYGHYKMLETAKKSGVNLILEPIGSEQLFSSTGIHFNQYLQDLWQRGEYKLFLDNFLGSSDSWGNKISQIKNLASAVIFRSSSDDLKETFIKASSEEFSYLKTSFTDRYFKNLDEKIKTSPLNLNQLLISEIAGPKVREQLRTADRNSFLAGISVRYPFVTDREMAEAMLKANSIYKIRTGTSGNILRKAMRGILPEPLLKSRRRHSQNYSENSWLIEAKEDLKEYITTDLDDFIDSRKIKKDWDSLVLLSGKNKNEFLWRVINLAIWRRVYFNS